jgi:hypothetical protein
LEVWGEVIVAATFDDMDVVELRPGRGLVTTLAGAYRRAVPCLAQRAAAAEWARRFG